ncbi:hypothetical protein DENIS_1505 [Desulfonema ishimotonii]|uniref:Cyclic nucleotide-binding domain-containing protein n=1 Tax=Desulfonema ishimotonii TaxID=45657 RepID=A0A401FUD0_9BACT|nr:cyclic nucleotide-binding domain-containing protein [Desulfonema ishimotonii]GBC60548.1 hypothetical protein DENIS_1505 [Desulfonema ishimotonii]
MIFLKYLRQIPIFTVLSDADIVNLQDICLEKDAEAGEIIFSEGSSGDNFFIIIRGSVEIWKNYSAPSPNLLSVYGPGQIFGELAIIDDFARSATVVVRQPSKLLCINRDDFNRVARPSPITLAMMRSLSAMVRERTEIFVEGLRTRNRDIEQLRHNLKKAGEECEAARRNRKHFDRDLHRRQEENLRLVLSLMDLQTEKIRDTDAAQVFRDTQNRIRTLADIHAPMVLAGESSRVTASPYFDRIVRNRFQTSEDRHLNIRVDIQADDMFLEPGDAFPVGLMVSELVANAFQHAFPDDRTGHVRILMEGRETITLSVRDDGIGLPGLPDTTDTLGLRLVSGLAEEQLGGSLELKHQGGTELIIRFAPEHIRDKHR